MPEGPSPKRAAAEKATQACLNCGQLRSGRYCQQCGADGDRRLRRLPELIRESLSEVFEIEGRTLRTLALLLTRPGSLALEYSEGRRGSQLGPVRLYLVAAAGYFLIFTLMGDPVVPSGAGTVSFSGPFEPLVWTEFAVALLIPLWAIAAHVAVFDRKRYLEESLVFSVHYHVFFLFTALLSLGAIALGRVLGAPNFGWRALLVTGLFPLPYLYLALRRACRFGRLRGAVTAVVLFVVHIALGTWLTQSL